MKKLMNLVVMTTIALLVCSCGNNARQSGESKDNIETETQTETVVEEEKYFSYQLLGSQSYSRTSFMDSKCLTDFGYFVEGLIVCYGDSKTSQYLLFDDEEDYNESIYEWALALKTAKELSSMNDMQYKFDMNVEIGEGEYCDYMIDRRRGDTLITYTEYTYQNYRSYAIDNYGDTIQQGDTIKGYDYIYFENPEKSIGQLLDYVHCMPNCIDSYKNAEIVELFKKTYYDLQDAGIYAPEKGYGFRKYPIDDEKYGHDYVKLYRIKEGEYKNVPGGVLGIKFESDSPW